MLKLVFETNRMTQKVNSIKAVVNTLLKQELMKPIFAL